MSNTQDPIKLAIEAIKAALSDDKPYLDLCGRALVALEARLQSPAPQPPGDAREACGYEACDCRNYCKKQAATAQASEPSAEVECVWNDPSKATVLVMHGHQLRNGQKLYAAPPRAVEPLTDGQRAAIMKRWHGRNWTAGDIIDAVEAHYLGTTTTPAAKGQSPSDPMDWPLPCDVTVGHGTMRKGVPLRTLVHRMKALYEMATGRNADAVAAGQPAFQDLREMANFAWEEADRMENAAKEKP